MAGAVVARTHAKVKTAIWANPDFLKLSMGAQWLFHVILEQPSLSLCGVGALTVARWAQFAPDATVRSVRAALTALVKGSFVVVDEGTEEVWVRSFTKHDGVLRQPNIVVAMAKDFGAIHSQTIRRRFIHALPDPFPEPDAKGFDEAFVKGLPEPFRQALLTRGRAGADSDSTTDSSLRDLTSGTTTSEKPRGEPEGGRTPDIKALRVGTHIDEALS